MSTTLTPNRRLAATLSKRYADSHAMHSAWASPTILPIHAWVQQVWETFTRHTLTPCPILLTPSQELCLWQQIISTSEHHTHILDVAHTAELARSAWQLLKQWQIPVTDKHFETSADYTAFQQWALAFQTRCDQHQWIDTASVPDYLIRQIQTKKITADATLILQGFTDLSPQFTQLVNCYTTSWNQDNCTTSATCYTIAMEDETAEIRSMARYAKSIWEKQPTARIACILPSLDKHLNQVTQLFSEVFENNTPFNISAGISLLHCPVIHAAFDLLMLNKTTLLHSTFVGEAETERLQRARLDKLLREQNDSTRTISHSLMQQECPHLANRIASFKAIQLNREASLSYRAWAAHFHQLLSALGWPGERHITSEEYQQISIWLEVLSELQQYDMVAPPCSYHQALSILRQETERRLFQPKTPDAPIQILGVLEAAGIEFDYIWLAGMHDLDWPPMPKPHPFIPRIIQREQQMPHATTARELEYCRTLLDQFKQHSTQLIFSYSTKKDNVDLRLSPLIQDVAPTTLDTLLLGNDQSITETIYHAKAMEYSESDPAPAVLANEIIKGGANIIKQQAGCPFKAFAECRLHAKPLETTSSGLRAKDRGIIIHSALEKIWSNIANSSVLQALDDEALHMLIDSSIQDAFKSIKHHRKNYLGLEKIRLQKLLWHWLQVEKQRAPFKIDRLEKQVSIQLHQLTLTLRIDRIDELENGKKLIIDYKTGRNNTVNTWFGERPDEPQLPLYLLLDSQSTVGISFAQIVAGQPGFKGISEINTDIPGIKSIDDWKNQINGWEKTFVRLATDFYQGIADVDPKEGEQTCGTCHLKALCRISDGEMIT